MIDPATLSLILGVGQTVGGMLMPKQDYPSLDYRVPDAQLQSLNNARYMASLTELPGASTAREDIGRSSANSISQLTDVADSPAGLMGAIGRVGAQRDLSLRDLATKNASFYTGNQAALRGELGRYAQYEDKEQMVEYQDRLREYEMKQDRKQSLIGGGMTNIFGSLNNMYATQFYEGLLRDMKKGNGAASSMLPIINPVQKQGAALKQTNTPQGLFPLNSGNNDMDFSNSPLINPAFKRTSPVSPVERGNLDVWNWPLTQ